MTRETVEPIEDDEPGVPAEDPEPRGITFPDLFGANYAAIRDVLLVANNSMNKMDNQQLRLKAVNVAERLTYHMIGRASA